MSGGHLFALAAPKTVSAAATACREIAQAAQDFANCAAAAREKRSTASPCASRPAGVPLTVGGGRLPSHCADCIAARRRAANKTLSGGRRVTDMDTLFDPRLMAAAH